MAQFTGVITGVSPVHGSDPNGPSAEPTGAVVVLQLSGAEAAKIEPGRTGLLSVNVDEPMAPAPVEGGDSPA